MRPLIIGQALGRGGGAATPLTGGSSGRRLASLAGVAPRELPRLFRLRNLLGAWLGPGGAKGDAFPAEEAREAARRLRPRGRVVLLGRGVAAAFGEGRRPLLRWFAMGRARAAVLPHPSGVCRWWNDERNVRRAKRFVGALLRRASEEAAPRKKLLPLSKEEGWRATRRRWRDEARAVLRRFPKIKDGKITYDYGLVRTVRAELRTKSRPEKAILWGRIRKWLIDRGYDPTGPGVLECLRFRVEVCMTPTKLVLRVECRRDDEVDDVPIYYKITQANYVENRRRELKGRTYTDFKGEEVTWSGREHELRQMRYYHECVVKRAIRAGLRVTKRVMSDYPELARRAADTAVGGR